MEYEVKAQVTLDYTVRVDGRNLLDAVQAAENGVARLRKRLEAVEYVDLADPDIETVALGGHSMISATVVGEGAPPIMAPEPKKERKPRAKKMTEAEKMGFDGVITADGRPVVDVIPPHGVAPQDVTVPTAVVSMEEIQERYPHPQEDAVPLFQPQNGQQTAPQPPQGAPLPPPPPMLPLPVQQPQARPEGVSQADEPYCPRCGSKLLAMGGTTDLWCDTDQLRVPAESANYAPSF